ncbi:hypothetical protein ACFSYD_12815 [Paracoccus aerius]
MQDGQLSEGVVRMPRVKKPVRIGSLKGLASYVPDLLEPMTEEELKEWG